MEKLILEKPAANQLLAALPKKEYQRLPPRLEEVDFLIQNSRKITQIASEKP
jgi:hypothetical protein